MNIFEITLDVDKRANKESVNLRQGDIYGTTIRATLKDHDVPMEGGDYTAMFCMTLPDRKTFYHDNATYENGVVSVVVDEQHAAVVPGTTNNAYFELYDGEELKYTTASFIVRVKPSAMDGEAAHSYDPRVEALMAEMRDLIDEETEAEAGRVEAETGRVTAEQGRVDTFTTNEAARDETFTANEGRRAATFVETEGARSNLFLEHEDERQETFETNESARSADYAEKSVAWAQAEAARQATFDENETERQEIFNAFASPTVSVEETETGQVAHITWKDSDGVHVSDMVIDDAVNVAMTGDTFSVPVDPSGVCVENGTARFYFSGWVGNRMTPCTATITTAADSRFAVRITNATAREQGLIRVDYIGGTTYPVQTDVCTISLSCGGRTFLHRISAVAPRGGVATDGADGLSPTVAITDVESGHVVTITDANGEHSYNVPTYAAEEAARVNAESARATAEVGRADAEAARADAESARVSAETVREQTVEEISEKIDGLTARGAEVDADYLYRQTNDGESVAGKVATVTSIRGRTLVWNQLITHDYNQTRTGVTFTSNADGSITITGTNTNSGNQYPTNNLATDIPTGHTYLVRGANTANAGGGGTDGGYNIFLQYTGENVSFSKQFGNNGKIFVPSTSRSDTFLVRIQVGNNPNITFNDTFYPQLFDLTLMFGAGNEPATVAEFEALYPLTHYPYDVGTLLPVRMTGIETVGFNQWDEEVEAGGINTGTGQNTATTGYNRSKNYISVFPSTEYYIKAPTTMALLFYDADGAFIAGSASYRANTTFTTPANARYMRFRNDTADAWPTYNHDICINLSDPARNGEYQPYAKSVTPIDLDGHELRSLPDGTRDELTVGADGRVTLVQRVGAVTFDGTQTTTWFSQNTTGNMRRVAFALPGTVTTSSSTRVGNAASDRFSIVSNQVAQQQDVTSFNIRANNTEQVVFNMPIASFATQEETLAWFAANPTEVIYELATPTTTTFPQPLSMTYRVEQGGTERVMVDETIAAPQSAPVPMKVCYNPSVVDNLLTMPEDYISHASFASFCTALEQAANLTITETWNESAGRYDYVIVS